MQIPIFFFQPENKYVEDKYEYFPRDATNNPAKSVPYINPAPHNILNKADSYIISYVGKKYFDDYIYMTKSYVAPDENKDNVEYNYYSANKNKKYPKYKIDYDYKFRINGDSEDTIVDFDLYLDENGNLVDEENTDYRYEGPQRKYSFSISRDEVIAIAKSQGIESIEEIKIIFGLTFKGDKGKLTESYVWHITADNPKIGSPEVVYIDVDTGEGIDVSIKKEERISESVFGV